MGNPFGYDLVTPARERQRGATVAPEATALTGSGAPEPEGFDPSAGSVADVLAYVEAHPESKDDVLAAERSGKARKGILTAFD